VSEWVSEWVCSSPSSKFAQMGMILSNKLALKKTLHRSLHVQGYY
jgi:hypothetical protein